MSSSILWVRTHLSSLLSPFRSLLFVDDTEPGSVGFRSIDNGAQAGFKPLSDTGGFFERRRADLLELQEVQPRDEHVREECEQVGEVYERERSVHYLFFFLRSSVGR